MNAGRRSLCHASGIRSSLRAADGRAVAALDCGAGHWNSPIVADGRIALPEGNANSHKLTGALEIWRVLRWAGRIA
jgi:hypothetical protein